jgi:hypothetical protein
MGGCVAKDDEYDEESYEEEEPDEDLDDEDLDDEDLDELPDLEEEDDELEELDEDEAEAETEEELPEDDEEPEDEEESLDVLLTRDKGIDEELVRGDEPRDGLSVTGAVPDVGEFTCRSCFLVKRQGQLADAKKLICLDCA